LYSSLGDIDFQDRFLRLSAHGSIASGLAIYFASRAVVEEWC